MARLRLEDRLAQLTAKARQKNAASVEALRTALTDDSSLLAAKAATLAKELQAEAVVPEAVTAFLAWCDRPAKEDKQCYAKRALIEALLALKCDDERPFLRGLKCVQMEPVYGGQVDTAGHIRAVSAMGLVSLGHRRALIEAAVLLADPDPEARLGAVEALAALGAEACVALLRYKLIATPGESDTIRRACYKALLDLAPEEAVSVLEETITGPDAEAGADAALVLAESRRPEAFPILKRAWDAAMGDTARRRALLLPMALTRQEEAFDFLLGLLDSGRRAGGEELIDALKICGDSPARRARLRETAQELQDKTLMRAAEEGR